MINPLHFLSPRVCVRIYKEIADGEEAAANQKKESQKVRIGFTEMNGLSHLEPDFSEFVEVDPTGRYGRYNEILGKGASKTVYRAFDEYEGMEVAWNQVKLYDFLQSPEDLERLYCEIHLLKTLKHGNIMKFYTSWVDPANRNINFVTEMFTSGTLKQYRLKHKRVNIRAVKHWCRQILRGLLYLHSHDPPVIHRDLKCDNIFINGNQGEVKIGDLGLAAILRKSQAAHCVGTPEFMAPEVYEEAYNELVDIYSFGMCILEMVTFEYPYSECSHPVQIYKKVVSGKKPDALYKVKDPEVRQFVEKCLATASLRLSARELLNDRFLQMDECEYDLRSLDYSRQLDNMGPFVRQPLLELHQSNSSFSNGYSNGYNFDAPNEWGYQPVDVESTGIELFEHREDDHSEDVGMSIKGNRIEDGGIFFRLRITDKGGRVRNIYFTFDTENDTALSVSTEMVAELVMTDQDVTRIADMIDGVISLLVPDWQSGPGLVETPPCANQSFCHNYVSNHTSSGSMMEYLSNHPSAKDLQAIQCCKHGCPSMHGRFEEITYQVDESEHHVKGGAPNESSQSDCPQYQEIWGQQPHESRELSSVGSGQSHSDEEYEKMDHLVTVEDEQDPQLENTTASGARNSIRNLSGLHSISILSKSSLNASKVHKIDNGFLSSVVSNTLQGINNIVLSKSCAYDHRHITPDFLANLEKSCPNLESQRARNCEAMESPKENVITANSLYTGSLLPHSLRRAVSLPVDAVDL
ncbi:hypothetical protein ACFX15_010136 [Malus domestica]|uniref:non-specific serine/threonine protein kinase n=1 Tax=Malus domestica TaxID=3750 RepID=A0A498IGB2_MALDO|nr:hypothetical protein DVH24_036747 [Malus domestica]